MTLVVAAGASAELVLPTDGTAETESNQCRRQRNVSTAGTAIVGGDGGSYTSGQSPNEQRGRQSSYVARVRGNRETRKRRKGAHPKQRSQGGAPAHARQHRGSKRNGCEAAGPDEEASAIFHGVVAAGSNAVVFGGRLWQTRQEMVFPLVMLLGYSRV